MMACKADLYSIVITKQLYTCKYMAIDCAIVTLAEDRGWIQLVLWTPPPCTPYFKILARTLMPAWGNTRIVFGNTVSVSLHKMIAVEETGGCASLSELVTGVTTRQCCWWVSPHTTHTSNPTHCGG